jgi:hypothetical protein
VLLDREVKATALVSNDLLRIIPLQVHVVEFILVSVLDSQEGPIRQ